MGNNPAGWVLAVIVIFVLFIVGAFLFPGLHTEILGIDTSSWNNIAAVIHAFIPYGFILAVAVGIMWRLSGRGN
jgi:hypothetical protein